MNEMIKSKKGAEGVPWWLILFVIGITFLAVWFFIAKPIWTSFNSDTGRALVEQKLKGCLEKKDNPLYKGYNDEDKDEYLDFCDNCPYVSNKPENDRDGDLFPYGCCGNDGESYIGKSQGWCGDKMEMDDNSRKYPKYNPKSS